MAVTLANIRPFTNDNEILSFSSSPFSTSYAIREPWGQLYLSVNDEELLFLPPPPSGMRYAIFESSGYFIYDLTNVHEPIAGEILLPSSPFVSSSYLSIRLYNK